MDETFWVLDDLDGWMNRMDKKMDERKRNQLSFLFFFLRDR